MLRFAHLCEHFVRHMFRSHFELSADMVFDQFPEEALILICHQIIKADTGTDKHFLDFRDLPQFTQQDQIIFVVCPHILARLWKQIVCSDTRPFSAVFRMPDGESWRSVRRHRGYSL